MARADMRGRTCLITGASAGIGKETAIGLCRMGARVLMVARSSERGRAALAEVRARTGSRDAELLCADLASFESLRRLAAVLRERGDPIDVLIHNAAVYARTRQRSADGIELTLAVNHLAPFLLTHLVWSLLRAAPAARVVVVASQVEEHGRIDLADLEGERSYHHRVAYRQSKLANVMFTYRLARVTRGSGVTANCLHPGVIATRLLGDYLGRPRPLSFLTRLRYKSPRAGARTSLYVATEPSLHGVTGRFFRECAEARTSPASYDEDLQERLWQASMRMTGVSEDLR